MTDFCHQIHTPCCPHQTLWRQNGGLWHCKSKIVLIFRPNQFTTDLGCWCHSCSCKPTLHILLFHDLLPGSPAGKLNLLNRERTRWPLKTCPSKCSQIYHMFHWPGPRSYRFPGKKNVQGSSGRGGEHESRPLKYFFLNTSKHPGRHTSLKFDPGQHNQQCKPSFQMCTWIRLEQRKARGQRRQEILTCWKAREVETMLLTTLSNVCTGKSCSLQHAV